MELRIMVATTAAAVMVLGLTGAAPAQAQQTRAKPVPYSLQKNFKSKAGCATVKLDGRVSYTKDTYVSGAGHVVYVKKNPKLVAPRMVISLRNCKTGTPKKMGGASFTQGWHYGACSLNPSYSLSAPFSASVSVTPKCGRKKVAIKSSSFQSKHTAYAQNTSGSVRWKQKYDSTDPKAKGLCIRAFAPVKIIKKNQDYQKTIDMGRVCV